MATPWCQGALTAFHVPPLTDTAVIRRARAMEDLICLGLRVLGQATRGMIACRGKLFSPLALPTAGEALSS